MRYLLIIYFAMVSLSFCEDDEATWSKVENGLRGRLSVLPSQEKGSPFYRVFLELQNTADVMGQRKIRFNPDRMSFEVTDKEHKSVPPYSGTTIYDGMMPNWDPILLPYRGTIRFEIGSSGLGVLKNQKGVLDFGPRFCWIIPQADLQMYLSGSFTVQRERTDHPIIDWYGTIVFPQTPIPKQKDYLISADSKGFEGRSDSISVSDYADNPLINYYLKISAFIDGYTQSKPALDTGTVPKDLGVIFDNARKASADFVQYYEKNSHLKQNKLPFVVALAFALQHSDLVSKDDNTGKLELITSIGSDPSKYSLSTSEIAAYCQVMKSVNNEVPAP